MGSVAEWEIVALSLKVAAVATLALLPVAWALAYLLARGRFRGRLLLDAAVHLPLVLPPVVVGYALLILFAPHGAGGRLLAALGLPGPVFTWQGAALASAVMALPLSRPGLLAATVLGFARALGEFGATITFVAAVPGETMTLPLAIHAALQMPGGEPLAWRLSLFAVALSVAALIAADLLARRGR